MSWTRLSSDQVPPEGKINGTKKYWKYKKSGRTYTVKHERERLTGTGTSTNDAIRDAV